VKTLSNIHNVYKLEGDQFDIATASLFHRLVELVQNTDNVAACFAFELTPYPTSIFKDSLMREGDKSSLYRSLASGLTSAEVPANVLYVVDGGCLMHKVRWNKTQTFYYVLRTYVEFLGQHFMSPVCDVFDSYNFEPSTKDHEHKRRVSKSAPEMNVEPKTAIAYDQDAILLPTA
jgi:hypothetical protein